MGVVALGIGASPIGILIVGQLAETLDPQLALQIWAGIGVIVITALRWWLPELRDPPGQREAERRDSPLADDVAVSAPHSE